MTRRLVNVLTKRPVVVFTLVSQVLLCVHLLGVASTMAPDERDILSIPILDARYLFALTAAAGLAYAIHFTCDRCRDIWLVLLTASTLGRALDFYFVGIDGLARIYELRATGAWLLLWMLGVTIALLLTAYSQLQAVRAERDEK